MDEKPIDFIRRMNPGAFIPSGQELADLLKDQEEGKKFDWKICQQCGSEVPIGTKFCSDSCGYLFNQNK